MHNTKGTLSIVPSVKLAPALYMARELYNQVNYLIKHFDKHEVQWYHRVKKHTQGTQIVYELLELVIPHQTVSATEADTDAQQQLKTWYEIKARCTDEDGTCDIKAANEFVASMTCWSHSHVDMGVGPSGQDEKQFKEFIQNNDKVNSDTVFIMMIWNRSGDVYTRVYDPELGYSFQAVPLHVESETVDTDYVDEAIKDKITKRTYSTGVWQGGHRVYGSHIHGHHGHRSQSGNPQATSQKYTPSKSTQTGGSKPKQDGNTQGISAEDFKGSTTVEERTEMVRLADIINNKQNAKEEAEILARMIASILDDDGSAVKAVRHFLSDDSTDQAALRRWLSWENREYDTTAQIALLMECLINGWLYNTDSIWLAVEAADELGQATTVGEVQDLIANYNQVEAELEMTAMDAIL